MKLPVISLSILVCIVVFSFFGNFIYTNSPYALHVNHILSHSSAKFLFGTDRLGRDLLARVIEGGRVSL